MDLARFGYLQWRRIIAFVIILMLSSMLSFMTAFTLVSFHEGLSAYLGEGENIIVIYDVRSRTPFTGLVPAFLTEKISGVSGVLTCSPEIIVPCIVNGESIFLRGVLPKEFLKIDTLTIISGEMLDPEDLNFAVIGKRASERIGLKVGDKVLVRGVLSPTYLELRIKGVFSSGTTLDDEIIAPLHVGQWLRGAGYNYVTIIRVKVNESRDVRGAILSVITETSSKVNEVEEKTPLDRQESPRQQIARWTATRFRAEHIEVKGAEKFMENYIERYGVTRESIIVFSIATLIFSGATILFAAQFLVSQHGGEIEILRSIGVSRKLLRRDLILKLAPISILALLLGFWAAAIVLKIALESGLLQVLFHSVQPQVDLLSIALIVLVILVIVMVGVWRTVR